MEGYPEKNIISYYSSTFTINPQPRRRSLRSVASGFFVSLRLPISPCGPVALPRFQVALYPMRQVARLIAVHVERPMCIE